MRTRWSRYSGGPSISLYTQENPVKLPRAQTPRKVRERAERPIGRRSSTPAKRAQRGSGPSMRADPGSGRAAPSWRPRPGRAAGAVAAVFPSPRASAMSTPFAEGSGTRHCIAMECLRMRSDARLTADGGRPEPIALRSYGTFIPRDETRIQAFGNKRRRFGQNRQPPGAGRAGPRTRRLGPGIRPPTPGRNGRAGRPSCS